MHSPCLVSNYNGRNSKIAYLKTIIVAQHNSGLNADKKFKEENVHFRGLLFNCVWIIIKRKSYSRRCQVLKYSILILIVTFSFDNTSEKTSLTHTSLENALHFKCRNLHLNFNLYMPQYYVTITGIFPEKKKTKYI